MQKKFGISNYSILWDYNVQIKACLDDAMHTVFGAFARQYHLIMAHVTNQQKKIISARATVYPYVPSQQVVYRLGQKLPSKVSSQMTALVPLLLSLRGLFDERSCSVCSIDQLHTNLRTTHQLKRHHSDWDHFALFHLFIHNCLSMLE